MIDNNFFGDPIFRPFCVPKNFDQATAIDSFLKKMKEEGVSIHPNFTFENFFQSGYNFEAGKLYHAVIFPVLNEIKIKKGFEIIKEERDDLKKGGFIGMSLFIDNAFLDSILSDFENKFLIFPDKEKFLPNYQDEGKVIPIFHFRKEKSECAINIISLKDKIDKDIAIIFFRKPPWES